MATTDNVVHSSTNGETAGQYFIPWYVKISSCIDNIDKSSKLLGYALAHIIDCADKNGGESERYRRACVHGIFACMLYDRTNGLEAPQSE
jgi:hypothetical protein